MDPARRVARATGATRRQPESVRMEAAEVTVIDAAGPPAYVQTDQTGTVSVRCVRGYTPAVGHVVAVVNVGGSPLVLG
jgi:hypothetical protein